MINDQSTWTGMVPFEDTALAVTDHRGPGPAVVYLNGGFGSQGHWKPVISELGPEWRHITYDERARGRSKTSADYSVESAVRDVDAILEATGVERPVLVGWSFGATVAVQWAHRNPDRVLGVVSVDGAYPQTDVDDEAFAERARKLFRRFGPILPLLARFGLAARMSADQHAAVNAEVVKINKSYGPVLEGAQFPVRFVVATGGHTGGGDDELARLRATIDPVVAVNPNVRVSARVSSNHETILRKDSAAIAAAVREIAALTRRA